MKRLTTIFAVLALILTAAPSSFAADTYEYGWSISGSSVDPFANTGAFVPGLGTLYLWYQCNVKDGMSAAEFDIVSANAANVFLSFSATNGFLNAGNGNALLIAVGACPSGPIVAGTILILKNAPGEYCIAPSASNGISVTVDCDTNPTTHDNVVVGWSDAGAPGCGGRIDGLLCNPVSVDATSWGQVKGLYR